MSKRFGRVLLSGLLAAGALAGPAAAAPASDTKPHLTGEHAPFGVATKAEPSATPAALPLVDRVKGANRYETAVAVSRTMFPAGVWQDDDSPVERVFLASGEKFPDALSLGPLASVYGPILLVPATGTMPRSVKAELNRLDPDVVTVIGGTSSVSASMAQQAAATGRTIERIAGANRYDTGAKITASYAADLASVGVPVDTVFVTSGRNYPDALGGGAAAANVLGALLLTDPTSLPPETATALANLRPTSVVVLGGTSSVSDQVIAQIQAQTPAGASIKRVSGSNRYDTAAKVADWLVAEAGSPTEVFVTVGTNFPDALAAAPMSSLFGGPVLLSQSACLSKPTDTFVRAQRPNFVIGVGGGVSDGALLQDAVCSS